MDISTAITRYGQTGASHQAITRGHSAARTPRGYAGEVHAGAPAPASTTPADSSVDHTLFRSSVDSSSEDASEVPPKVRRLEEAQKLAQQYANRLGVDPGSDEGQAIMDKAVNFYSLNESLMKRFRQLLASELS